MQDKEARIQKLADEMMYELYDLYAEGYPYLEMVSGRSRPTGACIGVVCRVHHGKLITVPPHPKCIRTG